MLPIPKKPTNCTSKSSLWQAFEYRKRCYSALESRAFLADHDYDRIFNQIHKEIYDVATGETTRDENAKTA